MRSDPRLCPERFAELDRLIAGKIGETRPVGRPKGPAVHNQRKERLERVAAAMRARNEGNKRLGGPKSADGVRRVANQWGFWRDGQWVRRDGCYIEGRFVPRTQESWEGRRRRYCDETGRERDV